MIGVLCEDLSKFCASVVESAHDGPFGAFELLGDFFIAHAFNFAKYDHSFVIFREALDGSEELFSKFFVADGLHGVGAVLAEGEERAGRVVVLHLL